MYNYETGQPAGVGFFCVQQNAKPSVTISRYNFLLSKSTPIH